MDVQPRSADSLRATGLRDALREHTRRLHHDLDAQLPLLRDPLTLDVYTRHLSRMASWLPPVEAVIHTRLNGRVPMPLTVRSPWLLADLEALGQPRPAPASAAALPPLDCACDAVGALYVLEGSALGGQIIARQLTTIGVTPTAGGRYFEGHGHGTAERWRTVCAVLDAYAGSPARSIDAARRTFASLAAWLA